LNSLEIWCSLARAPRPRADPIGVSAREVHEAPNRVPDTII
jgi:hypothetical protein